MSRSKRSRRRNPQKTSRSSVASRQATQVESVTDPLTPEKPSACEERSDSEVPLGQPAAPDSPTDPLLPHDDPRWGALVDLLHRIDGNVREVLASQPAPSVACLEQTSAPDLATESMVSSLSNDERDAYETRLQELRGLLQQQEDAFQQLQNDYEGLASQQASECASETIRQTVAVDESLSWDERKQAILQQMETGDFDAESFVSSLSGPQQGVVANNDDANASGSLDADAWIRELLTQVEKARDALQERETEINELRACLDHQKESLGANLGVGGATGGTAMGAAAIAEMIDSDELIREERQRLQDLKTQWEEKFRSAEVAASLERAKLSRERQELAKRNAELEERLEQLQRDQRIAQRYGQQDAEPGKTPRKWLAELGLAGSTKA
ncbi:MAG: hypothetical protein AAGD07_02955 [Planctomycetota bacterium]